MAYYRCTGNSGGSLKLRTASGDIASFETNLPEPYQSVLVNVEATQLGSGTPYPPGGGKNKLNIDDVEIGTAWNGSPNSARARLIIPCEPSTNYVLSMNGTMAVDGVYFGESETIPPSGIGAVTFPKIFTTEATSHYITLGFNKTAISKADVTALKLQLELGTSPTDYAPYSNICPINGYTEANITRCGVNLVKFTEASYTNSGITCKVHADNSIEVLNTSTATISFMILEASIKAGSYILSGCEDGNLGTYAFRIRDKNNTSNYVYSENGDSPVITFAQDTTIQLQLFVYGTTTVNKTFNIMLRKSTSASTFNPYTGNAYTIAFGQTVYGGVLDVTRGKLKLLSAEVDMGSLSWINYGNTPDYDRYISTSLDSLAKANGNVLCSALNNVANTVNSTWVGGGNGKLSATSAVGAYSNANAFKNAVTGYKLIYELATPFDIDLTPEVISAVVGTNNVFADCGETEVKYLNLE